MKRNYENAAGTAFFRSIMDDLSKVPVSFTYAGVEYHGLSKEYFTIADHEERTADGRETHTFRLSFVKELTVRLILSHYVTHGVTEWTVWFENESEQDSGILENIRTDLSFDGKYPMLKGIMGDHMNQYTPYAHDLQQNTIAFSADTGRATHIDFPYFNLEYGDEGAMLAIGWGGTWSARFTSDGTHTTYTASSVNGLRTYLKGGEKIRTALFVYAPYTRRSEQYATNFWRSWFVEYNLPKADAKGTPLQPFSTGFLALDTGLPNSDGSISERYTTWRPSLEKMLVEDVKTDFRWFDAGWYVAPDGTSAQPYVSGHDWWDTVGTWELDPIKWPDKTFLESTEFARQHGMKTLVWFEPERVTDPENLAKYYGYNPDWAIRIDGLVTISNNIGDPDCWEWTKERVCKMLRENKVEMYREDNNCEAATLWNYLDTKEGSDRKGITEAKLIDGHYRLWDAIIECTASGGGCAFVDSCASGGGRNDLESMRRSVPLLRSDSDRMSSSLRLSMTTAFNKWIPFNGANTREKQDAMDTTGVSDSYVWRASYLAALNVDSQYVYEPQENFDNLRFGLREWKRVSPYLLKEFYPLTPWHKEQDKSDFTAYCYFDPETESGVLLAFRQEYCARDTLRLALPFSSENDRYSLTDEDSGEEIIVTNRECSITFASPRTAKLFWVKKA